MVDTAAAIAIVPLATGARFSLRLPPAAAIEVGQLGGFPLDTPINTCLVAGDRMMARLGPDEWLLLGAEAESDAIERTFTAALDGRFFSLVNIAHSSLAFAVIGVHACDVINGGCPLDLDDTVFPAGSATRTLLGKAGIVLMRPGGERFYRVECGRSFAPYVLAYLDDIAREFLPA